MITNIANQGVDSLNFIGRITTPYQDIASCPNNITRDGPLCSIELDWTYQQGLIGLNVGDSVLILYWLAGAERQVKVHGNDSEAKGTFALRTPNRPNPIGAAILEIVGLSDSGVVVRGLDCLNGTPLLDIKPAIMQELK